MPQTGRAKPRIVGRHHVTMLGALNHYNPGIGTRKFPANSFKSAPSTTTPAFSTQQLSCLRVFYTRRQDYKMLSCLNIMSNAVNCSLQLLTSGHQLRAREIVIPNEQEVTSPFASVNVVFMAEEGIGNNTWLQRNIPTHQFIKGPLKHPQLLKIDIWMSEA